MDQQELFEKLEGFYPGQVFKHLNTVQVTIETTQRKGSNKLTADEVYAAMNYQGRRQAVRQIDDWTVVILCDAL